MADYRATSTEFTAVADAIRIKGGTSAQLTWPNGFVSAVQAIPTGSGVTQPLSVTQNGTYTPPSGVDGYAPVVVNVSGGGGSDIDYSYLPNSAQANVLMSEDWHKYENSLALRRIVPPLLFQDDSFYLNGNGLCQDLESEDSSVTCYLACKGVSGANGFPLSVPYSHSSNNCPLFYFSSTSVKYANFGGDVTVSGITSTDYHVYAIAVDSVNKKSRFFVDGAFVGEKTGLSHSGNRVSIAKDKLINGFACTLYFRYGGVVSQFESDSDIIANMQTIMTKTGIS